MANGVVVAQESRDGTGFDLSLIEILAGEAADRIHRLPAREHHEFDSLVQQTLAQMGAEKAFDMAQFGHHHLTEMLRVIVHSGRFGTSTPFADDHGSSLASGEDAITPACHAGR